MHPDFDSEVSLDVIFGDGVAVQHIAYLTAAERRISTRALLAICRLPAHEGTRCRVQGAGKGEYGEWLDLDAVHDAWETTEIQVKFPAQKIYPPE